MCSTCECVESFFFFILIFTVEIGVTRRGSTRSSGPINETLLEQTLGQNEATAKYDDEDDDDLLGINDLTRQAMETARDRASKAQADYMAQQTETTQHEVDTNDVEGTENIFMKPTIEDNKLAREIHR